MGDLIDKGKVERILHNMADHLKEQNTLKGNLIASVIEGVAIDTIHSQQTVDAVKVVRCRDCARASEKDGIFMCGYFGAWMDPYEYCSQGERKPENE